MNELNYTWLSPNTNKRSVLLFLHEALGSIGQWKSFPQDLCDTLELPGVVYERRGHGSSPPLVTERDKNYLHEYALTELPAFIDYLIEHYGTEQFILVGHSDGGTIALLYAAHHSERIQKIITLAAHVINEPETVAGIAPAVKAYETGKLDGLKKYHGDKTEALFYAWANIWRSDNFQDWNITEEIKSIQVPVLSIQGKDDQYGTEKQLNLIKDATDAETVFIEACGHHPHLEQGELCVERIARFIRQS